MNAYVIQTDHSTPGGKEERRGNWGRGKHNLKKRACIVKRTKSLLRGGDHVGTMKKSSEGRGGKAVFSFEQVNRETKKHYRQNPRMGEGSAEK